MAYESKVTIKESCKCGAQFFYEGESKTGSDLYKIFSEAHAECRKAMFNNLIDNNE